MARCVSVISLGTQHSDQFADTFKVMLGFELPTELVTIEGQQTPMVITKDYTCSLNKKANLRQHLDSWRGRAFTPEELKGFDMKKILGVPCLLTIIHKVSGQGKTYATIAGISGLPKGMACPEQFHASVSFEIEEGPDSETFKKLPQWVQAKIKACEEWTPTKAPAPAAPEPLSPMTPADGVTDDDGVPF